MSHDDSHDDPKDEGILGQAKKLAKKAISAAEKILGAPEAPAVASAGREENPLSPALRAEADRPTSPFIRRPPLPAPQPGFAAPATPKEPFGMLDLEEPPETYGVDEVTILARDPHTLFVYWEVTGDGRAAARAALRGDGALLLRVFSVSTSPEGQSETQTIDVRLDWDHGRRYLAAPRPGAHVTAAVGLVAADGRFAPICHAPRIKVPWADPGPDGPVEWMDVEPSRSRGGELERPRIRQRGPASALAGAGRAGLPRWHGGSWQHVAGSRVPLREGAVPSWEEMPSSPWRWREKERDKTPRGEGGGR